MHVRSGVATQTHYDHDCDRCVLVGSHWGSTGIEDVYLCVPSRGGMGSLIHRHSSEGSDYSSVPLTFEGEPDPERKRMAFSAIRTIEKALSLALFLCRAYEGGDDEDEEDREQTAIFRRVIDKHLSWAAFHLRDGDVTEEQIRQVDWFFDTDIGNKWPVIYVPHEHTPAEEG